MTVHVVSGKKLLMTRARAERFYAMRAGSAAIINVLVSGPNGQQQHYNNPGGNQYGLQYGLGPGSSLNRDPGS